MVKRLFFITGLLLIMNTDGIKAQVMTLEQARVLTIDNSPKLKANQALIQKSKHEVRSAYGLSNPIVRYESPTGNFMTLGIEQNFNFPTTYVKQKLKAKSQLRLVEVEAELLKAEYLYATSLSYLDVQYYEALKQIQNEILTTMKSTQDKAKQLYDAGEIDLLSYNKTANDTHQAQFEANDIASKYTQAKMQLQNYTYQSSGDIQIEPLTAWRVKAASLQQDNVNLTTEQAKVQQKIAEQEVSLTKSKNLPGISLGYLNQGERETKLGYRFNVGLTLPIWFGQNKATVESAKANLTYIEQSNKAKIQEQSWRASHLLSTLESLSTSIGFYENTSIKNLEEINNISQRMYDAGQISLIAHYTNIHNTFTKKIKYIELLKSYNETVLELEYITTK